MTADQYLRAMRDGASFDRDNATLRALADDGLCTRQALRTDPENALYYIAHVCGRCGTIGIGRSQRHQYCAACSGNTPAVQRRNALGRSFR